MSFKANAVSVTTTATNLIEHTVRGSVDDPVAVTLLNSGGQTVFIGDENVDTTDGYELVQDAVLQLTMKTGEKLYGIVAATTAEVRVLLENV